MLKLSLKKIVSYNLLWPDNSQHLVQLLRLRISRAFKHNMLWARKNKLLAKLLSTETKQNLNVRIINTQWKCLISVKTC